jgi:ribonuclease HI
VIFEKEFPQTSNNLTEYLAILEAMRWRAKNDPKIAIYSDSTVAI